MGELTGRAATRGEVSSLVNITSTAIRPVCGQYEVLVKVKAAGLTIEDLNYATASHHYALLSLSPTQDNPVILGQDFSGVVEEVGAKVENVEVGDSVLGLKPALRERSGCWAEYVAVNGSKLVTKPEGYSWAEAAAMPLSSLVAASVVKVAGFSRLPRVENPGHRELKQEEVSIETSPDNEALLLRRGGDSKDAKEATLCVVGAGTTIGMMVIDMLASRRIKVVGVCSKKSAAAVLASGAVAILDRNKKGGLGERGDLTFNKVIDCIGGQEVEDMCRQTLGSAGHLISIVRPGVGAFGDESSGVVNSLTAFTGTAARSVKSLFSKLKYSLVTLPMLGQRNILAEMIREGVKPVIDCEVDMVDDTKVKDAIERVVQHKNLGRVILVNNE